MPTGGEAQDSRRRGGAKGAVLVCHGSIVPYDAIGHDVAQMVALLQREQECFVYGENVLIDGLPRVDKTGAVRLLAEPINTVVYHHSIEWIEGEELLRRARARVVIKFHNITPARFFVGHHAELEAACRRGQAQTQRLQAAFPEALWISDSRFNLQEAGIEGFRRTAVVPPFHVIERWKKVRLSAKVLRALIDDDRVNLLAVGRLVPSKGFHTLVDAVAASRSTPGRRLHLRIVGHAPGGDDRYVAELRQRIARHGLQGRVRLMGQVGDEDLLALYLGSDYFVCASEHEGFCVPVVEAQFLRLPLIANNIPAVRETAGAHQLLVGGDPVEFAEAVAVLEASPEYRAWLIDQGTLNFGMRFRHEIIAQQFLSAMAGEMVAAA